MVDKPEHTPVELEHANTINAWESFVFVLLVGGFIIGLIFYLIWRALF